MDMKFNKFWKRYHNHIYGVIGIFGVLISILIWHFSNNESQKSSNIYIKSPVITGSDRSNITIIYSSEKENFKGLIGVEVRDNLLVGFDKSGNEWRRTFQSKIKTHILQDINKDRSKEIILGTIAEGEDHSKVIVLDSLGNVIWEYKQTSDDMPYYSPDVGRYNIVDLKFVDIYNYSLIIAIFNMHTWYQSVLRSFDKDGNCIGKLWHPGHLREVKILDDILVVRAWNNDLRQTGLSEDPNKNFSVIFAIKPSSLFGEAPPYFGRDKPNKKFEWYYTLSTQEQYFTNLINVPEGIMSWTSCGKAFYFDIHGVLNKVGFSDDYSCDENIKIVEIRSD